MQRAGRVLHRDAVARAHRLGQRLLECRHRGALRQEIGLQDANHGRDIGLVDRLASIGDVHARRSGQRCIVSAAP